MPSLVSRDFGAGYDSVTVLDTAQAVLLCTGAALVAGIIAYRSPHGDFLLRIFLGALLIRILVGSAIFVSNSQMFFGADAYTYDAVGLFQVQAWAGDKFAQSRIGIFSANAGSASGMIYLVAGIYELVGRNMLAVQFINATLGAATAPLIYLCAQMITDNSRVARLASRGVAFMPSLVLWSSQELKDGPIMFFLALSILATLKLGEKISAKYLLTLVFAVFSVLTFRFYVFYMLVAAIIAAFLIGMRPATLQSIVRQFVVLAIVACSISSLGVTRNASQQFEQFGSLHAVQVSRADQARSAQSGFGAHNDVSTPGGALMTIPTGLAHLLLAPFPWELTSFRQAITIPEMLVWWASFPLLILGIWYMMRFRLRQVSPILTFTMMLSIAYSVFQGNVGNAYRERAQLLIFYFIFVAVGYVLLRERYERREPGARGKMRRVKRQVDWRSPLSSEFSCWPRTVQTRATERVVNILTVAKAQGKAEE